MIERPRGGERALLVNVGRGQAVPGDDIDELAQLTASAGAFCVGQLSAVRQSPDPKTFVGSGKAEEIRQYIAQNDVELVVFDQTLSPSQERNLEKLLCARVLDRTGLILDIFAQRARSFEGKLQVELAQLRHLSTRLVRGWTHLERQKGGIGLRGPGETQLETDRRLIGKRIRTLRNKLDKVAVQRDQQRRNRSRAGVATVALVGYTNAGKSTLFNALTDSASYAADKLFATLDPTLRRLDIETGGSVVLADTVGFVRDLPHELVAAFRATLEETREAALLLHVIDAGDEHRRQRIVQVEETLRLIGADKVPQIRVYNKCDLADETARVERDGAGEVSRVWVSALTGEGIDALKQVIVETHSREFVHVWIDIAQDEGRLRARLYEEDMVRGETVLDNGQQQLEVYADARLLRQLCRQLDLDQLRFLDSPCGLADRSLQSGAATR